MKKIFSIFLSLLLLINSFLKEKNFTHAYDIKSLVEKYHNGFETKNFWWFDIPLFKTSEGDFQETDIEKKIEPDVRFFVKNVFQNEDGDLWGATFVDDDVYFIPGRFLSFAKDKLFYTFRFKKCPRIYQTENEFENSITRNAPVKEVKIYENNNIARGFDVALIFSKIKAMGYSGEYTFFVVCFDIDGIDAKVFCAKNEDLEEEPGKLDFNINEEFINSTGQQIKCDKDVSNHDNSDLIIEPGQKVKVNRECNGFYLLSRQDNIFLVNKNLLVPTHMVFFVMWGARIYNKNFKSLCLMKGFFHFTALALCKYKTIF